VEINCQKHKIKNIHKGAKKKKEKIHILWDPHTKRSIHYALIKWNYQDIFSNANERITGRKVLKNEQAKFSLLAIYLELLKNKINSLEMII